VFRGTFEYGARWRANDSLFAAIHAATAWLQGLGLGEGFETQRLAKLPLALLGVLVLALLWRRRASPERAALSFFLFFVAAAPTVHPWYVGLLVPLLALEPRPWLCAFTGTVFLAYHVLPGWLAERRWDELGWVKAVEYAPFYLGLCLWARPWRSRS
jgi:hypothetical protein